MALMDSQIMQLLFGGSAYMRNRREDELANRYNTLLTQYSDPGAPVDDPNATWQGGILGGEAPPEQFYLEAAGIPGYEDLAQGAQSQQGAMARQQQYQQYAAENMTMAERMRTALGIEGLKQDADDFRLRMLKASGAFDTQPGDEPLTPEEIQTYGRRQLALEQGRDILDWFSNTAASGKAIGLADRADAGATWSNIVLPYMQDRYKAGAMQKEELALFQRLAGDPSDWVNFTDIEKRRMQSVLDDMEAELRLDYSSRGLDVPEFKRGASAFARRVAEGYPGTPGITPQGNLRPVAPPAPAGYQARSRRGDR